MDTSAMDIRSRAYDLADTNDYAHWADIAARLQQEGFRGEDIRRFEHDHHARMMLARRLDQARELRARNAAAAKSPEEPFLHLDVRRTWWEWEATGELHEPVLVIETTLLSPARATHPRSNLLKDLSAMALAHYTRLGVIIDRIRLVPAR